METIAPVSFQISKGGFIEQTESQAKTTIPPGQGLRFTFQISLKNKLTRVENSLQLFFFRGSQQLLIQIGNPQLHNFALDTALDALLVFAKEFFTGFDSLYLSKRSHSLGTRLKWLSVPIHCHRSHLCTILQYTYRIASSAGSEWFLSVRILYWIFRRASSARDRALCFTCTLYWCIYFVFVSRR